MRNFKAALLLSFVLILSLHINSALAQSPRDPVTNPEAIVTSGHARFTVLTNRMIRVEWQPGDSFEDRSSFVIVKSARIAIRRVS